MRDGFAIEIRIAADATAAWFGEINANQTWYYFGWQSHRAGLQRHALNRELQGIHGGHVE